MLNRTPVLMNRTRVLVVDDDEDMVDSLLALLETEGSTPRVYSARTIVADVRDFDPDVIIMDIAMPGTSGWEAAEVRQHKLGKRPMLIAVTGQYPEDVDRILAETGEYDHYFIKPFDTKVTVELGRVVPDELAFGLRPGGRRSRAVLQRFLSSTLTERLYALSGCSSRTRRHRRGGLCADRHAYRTDR
jgi:CheY-like chemotaxis protein